MPAILEIVTDREIRKYARGQLSSDRVEAVKQALDADPEAETIFNDEYARLMKIKEQVSTMEKMKIDKREVKQGDSSRLSAKLLVAGMTFVAALGFVAFSAIVMAA